MNAFLDPTRVASHVRVLAQTTTTSKRPTRAVTSFSLRHPDLTPPQRSSMASKEHHNLNVDPLSAQPTLQPAQLPFAGRIGGNQSFIVDRHDPSHAALLARTPDAAPYIPLRESFDLRGFTEIELWKAALAECVGTMLIVYLTVWIGISPASAAVPTKPATAAGVFATSSFLGGLVGGMTNFVVLSLLIFCFSPVSGGHLNPNITVATFLARLTSFPRMVLYVVAQIVGASLAGLLVRASYGTRDFVVGGCDVDTDLVSVGQAFAIEFSADLVLLFMSFGVGLDPRQKQVFGPALAPIFVGLTLGVISFGTSFSKPGYAGVSANPARCFGVYVGSRFPGYHWIHWVGDISAGIAHGVCYFLVPPWNYRKPTAHNFVAGSAAA